MAALAIKKATKENAKLRLALIGVSGSGKTYTSLSIGTNFGKVLVIDTERGSASKYAGEFEFDVIELEEFSPANFIEAIALGEKNGYGCVIVDSLSHEWTGKSGVLELHDAASKRTKNSFTAWAEVTPKHNALINKILQSECHIIATLRAKTEHLTERDEKTGRTTVKKVGLAPVQRDGLEYEFDVVADIDIDNNFIVTKTRCSALSGKVFNRAGLDVASVLQAWLEVAPPIKISVPNDVQTVNSPIEPKQDLPATDAREKRAASIAAMGLVTRNGSEFTVSTPSLRGKQTHYKVWRNDNRKVCCNCLEFEENTVKDDTFRCEHILAVKDAMAKGTATDITPNDETAQAITGNNPPPNNLADLIAAIRVELKRCDKDETAFNEWYGKEYESTLNWFEASGAVLKELLGKAQKWQVK